MVVYCGPKRDRIQQAEDSSSDSDAEAQRQDHDARQHRNAGDHPHTDANVCSYVGDGVTQSAHSPPGALSDLVSILLGPQKQELNQRFNGKPSGKVFANELEVSITNV
jgi:hypothetical protein